MISKTLIAVAALAASGLVTVPSLAATNLISNGSFEDNTSPIPGSVCPVDWTCNYPRHIGMEPVSYWNVQDQGTNLVASPDGGNALGITGINLDGASTKFTSVSQSMTGLVVGATYSVSFYEATGNGSNIVFPTGTVGWTVIADTGGSSDVLGTASLAISAPHKSSSWVSKVYSFVAAGTDLSLSFLASATVATSPDPILLLDGVKVQQIAPPPVTPPVVTPVPEPSTWALTLAGLAAVGGIVRRRQRKGNV